MVKPKQAAICCKPLGRYQSNRGKKRTIHRTYYTQRHTTRT